MDGPVTQIGEPSGLHFELAWDEPDPIGSAEDATRGQLSAFVGGRLVWGCRGPSKVTGLSWTWIELLEHLASAWRYLLWEEADPLGLGVAPEELRYRARDRWDELPNELRRREEDALWSFEETHNLSAGLQGVWPANLWLLREGHQFHVYGNGAKLHQKTEEVVNVLSSLSNCIVERIRTLNDPRAVIALKEWQGRQDSTVEEFAVISTGLSAEILRDISGSRDIADGLEIDGFETNELLAAARMAGNSIPTSVLKSVVTHIRSLPAEDISRIDDLTEKIIGTIDLGVGDAFSEGQILATRLRRHLENPEGPTDPEKILGEMGIPIQDIELEAKDFDAVACWGPRHGPGVLVNKSGRHSGKYRGRRATLAHELCHLLVDRKGALPVAEVFGGRIPRHIEARARAFAAEFLLPRQTAGAAFAESGDPKKTLASLCARFGVSREIVAWQTRNSGITLTPAAFHLLRSQVTDLSRF